MFLTIINTSTNLDFKMRENCPKSNTVLCHLLYYYMLFLLICILISCTWFANLYNVELPYIEVEPKVQDVFFLLLQINSDETLLLSKLHIYVIHIVLPFINWYVISKDLISNSPDVLHITLSLFCCRNCIYYINAMPFVFIINEIKCLHDSW